MISGCLGVFNMNGGREGHHIVSYCWLVLSCYTPWNTLEIPRNPQWQMESNTIKHHITLNTINFHIHCTSALASGFERDCLGRHKIKAKVPGKNGGAGAKWPGSPQCHNIFSSKAPQKTGKVNQNGWILNVLNIFKLDYLDFLIVLGGCYDDNQVIRGYKMNRSKTRWVFRLGGI